MPIKSKSSPIKPVEAMITAVGRDLASSFTGVLEALPGSPHRPMNLARSLGVNTVLTSRLLTAARQTDPLAVAHRMPGPEPLRRLLRAAARKGLDPSLVEQARHAVDRFEQLIQAQAGDRSSLDAIISGWLPDARAKVELLAKQSVYRGMSQLLGTACELEQSTVLLHPSDGADDRVDQLWVSITRGLRRVRPGMAVKYDTVHAPTPMLTVAGDPVEGVRGLLLEQFCSSPLPRLDVTHDAGVAQYTLNDDAVGVQSAVDLVHATLLPRRQAMRRGPAEPRRAATVGVGISIPSRTFIFDALLHEDVYPAAQPVLRIYRTAGVFHRDPTEGDMNRLEVLESVQPLGTGASRFRAAETPGYPDIIRFVCKQRRWDPARLRGYRCRIEYPIYSSQIVLGFDLPEASRSD